MSRALTSLDSAALIAVAARRRHDNLLDALSAAEREVLERALGKAQARAGVMLVEPDFGFCRRR